ncbi:MAG: T9SS type A sorting domain-containing protein, partial [Gemmatimonadota bacterium]|nr:T9SS type A sorting domain-containing protein [Gemmatimonadota bacterium]
WDGIAVGDSGVKTLDLGDDGLRGMIPPELGRLSQLKWLSLYNNGLRGMIPPELGRLSQLEWLDLSGNVLIGTIPPRLGRLSQLEWLDLSGNVLIGTIPPELSQLIALRGLYLYDNQLIGTIPLELSQLTALRGLRLDDNGLTGVIPPALGRLTDLEDLNLDGNALIGCAPETLARWVNDLPVCSQVSKSSDAAVSAVTATVLGDEIEHLIVEFARTIPGRQPDYAWIGVTDEFGQLELIISSEDPVSGYYQARARNAAGEMVGQWYGIFLEQDRQQSLELILGGGVQVVASQMLDRGAELIAHYPFNGNARDASGNEYHGTLLGPEPTWDRFGNEDGAILFYDTDHRIDLPHKVLNGRLDVTIAFWLKTSKSGAQTIVSGANQFNDNEYIVFFLNEGLIRFYSHGNVGRNQVWCDVEIQPIADGTWHHFAVIRNASLGHADFFIDGKGYTKHCGHLVYDTLKVEAGGLILGQDQDTFGGGFDASQVLRGALDDLRIYDGILSATEVQVLMRESKPDDLGAAKEVTSVASGLYPNVPNPFNASTQITYRLAAPGPVRLEIYNVLGQLVHTLVDEFQAAGSYQVHWDARDQWGVPVASGIYLSRLHYPGGVQTRRLLLLK